MDQQSHKTVYSDHDLLIRVDTRLDGLTDEVRLMRDGTKNEIKDLQQNKVDKESFRSLTDIVIAQGKQIEILKRLVYIGVGGVIVLQLVIGLIYH